MRRIIRFASLSLICLLFLPVLAQEGDRIPYLWQDVGLSLSYPAGWDEPIPAVTDDGRQTLALAQSLSASPDTRPPGIPFINFALFSPLESAADLTPFLEADLASTGVTLVGTGPSDLLGLDALAAEGMSEDGLLFAVSRGAMLADGRILLITGRAPEVQRDTFTALFNTVAESLSLDAASAPVRPIYGVLWRTIRTGADGEAAFVNLMGAAYHADKIYAVDKTLGVVEFDATTGAVRANYLNPDLQLPTSLAVNSEGIVYVADPICQCIQVLNSDGSWEDPITGFEPQSPTSIVVASDDSLYATELTAAGIRVRLFGAEEGDIPFGPEVVSQPVLGLDSAGSVLALTQDGVVLVVSDADLAPLATLNTGTWFIEDFAMDTNGNFVLATDAVGVVVVSAAGETLDGLGRIVANEPLPGEFVHPRGVTFGDDGTIYIIDSDGSFGAVTAMNTSISAGRIGSTVLIPGVAVQGTLDEATPQQDWTLSGVAGQNVTISAVDATGSGFLDVGLELVAPDGSVEASNDDQTGADLTALVDAQISDHILAADGDYTVRVTLVGGSGTYRLGVIQQLPFTLDSDGTTELSGSIEGALPRQRWMFEGVAGQVFTVTMTATSGVLDPLLRLLDANGQVIAENDDASDTALGKDAQLVQVTLPADGMYTLEAARFEGQGNYSIVIVATS